MNESDEVLVRRAQQQDRSAFEELVRRTARLLFARLYLETGDAHRAEDLVQETFLVAWRSIRQVTDAKGFRAWLLSISHSVAVDAIRREGRQKRNAGERNRDAAHFAPGKIEDVIDRSPAPSERAEQEESRQRVLGILRSLPEEYRLPLTLRYLAGADYETIGRQLGLSNGSLRGLLNRGMARLRAEMKR